VIPDEEMAKKFMAKAGKNDLAEVYADATFKKEIMEDMNRLGTENKLSSLEKPKDIFVTGDAFSIENDMLTPTYKLKRNIAKKVYQAQIDEMYAALNAQGK